MSVEFVEPEPAVAPAPSSGPARSSAPRGRVVAATAVLAAVLVGLALLLPLYTVERTAFVVDFDGTTTQDATVPYDAFGHGDTVPLRSPATSLQPGGGAYESVLSVSLSDGVAYGPWWLGGAALLVVVAGWGFLRPRAGGPLAAVAGVGGLLLGSVGAAWLAIRRTSDSSVPQIRFAAHPDAGLWLIVSAGAVALLVAVVAATVDRRGLRARTVRAPGPDPA